MNARSRILARLQENAPNATLPAPPRIPELPSIPEAERVDRLCAQLQQFHAEVHRVESNGLGQAVGDWCRGRGLRNVLVPAAGLPIGPSSLDGIAVVRFDQPLEQFKPRLFAEIDAGMTVADCAVAENGTLVLASSPLQPRSLSLVPPIHLCLLDARRIHSDMAAAMAHENWARSLPTNLIFISGPSKTADIQQTLAYGAHGPKELVVFIHGEVSA